MAKKRSYKPKIKSEIIKTVEKRGFKVENGVKTRKIPFQLQDASKILIISRRF